MLERFNQARTTQITRPFHPETRTNAPRFLYDSGARVYYTDLAIDNTSDVWFIIRLIIKNRGATELLGMGAKLGEEFTEDSLKILFARRWVYRNP